MGRAIVVEGVRTSIEMGRATRSEMFWDTCASPEKGRAIVVEGVRASLVMILPLRCHLK